LLLTKAVRVPKPGEIPAHEQFYYLELLRRAGWIDKLNGEESISLILPSRAKDRAGDYMLAAGARPNALRIAIGAGASYGSAKCWAPERFAEVANRMIEEFDAEVVLFGTAGERAVADAIAAAMRRPPIDLIGKTSMAELPGLLSECQLFVGNDSGAMHVAAAVGVPVVAIFGSTDPNGTAPVTPRCSIVQEKPYCNPCFLRRCPTDHRCMSRILPAAVEEAARSWLATKEVRPA
jgi:heptosyltransferase-2